MATAAHSIDGSPAALSGLTDDTAYLVQNTGSRTALIAAADSAPDAGSAAAIFLDPGQMLLLTPTSGSALYCWCRSIRGTTLVTSEAS